MVAGQFSSGRRGERVKVVVLLYACLWGLVSLSCAEGVSVWRQELKVEKQLRRLNKPFIKTIQSPDGDNIDCVSISQQPAFDHPSLKDHKIQMRPSYHPEGHFDENEMSMGSNERTEQISQLWHTSGKCPTGTIPIRRTKKEDLLRASSVKRYGKKHTRSIPKPNSANAYPAGSSAHEHAIAYVEGDKYYGAKATINVWKPEIQQPNEFSLSQIWLLGGTLGQDLNTIEAGWQVNPGLYGDNSTRLFTYWTSDAYRATGCYNLLCSGFIQINDSIALGASIRPVSSPGSSQYDISILIWKDPNKGNWWMQFGNDCVLGYWPSFLFSYLSDSASSIHWGGEVVNLKPDGRHTSTQMGSGSFPEEGFAKSSYFKNIQVVGSSNNLEPPKKGLKPFTDQHNCYDVKIGEDSEFGHYLYYGGPGKNPRCP